MRCLAVQVLSDFKLRVAPGDASGKTRDPIMKTCDKCGMNDRELVDYSDLSPRVETLLLMFATQFRPATPKEFESSHRHYGLQCELCPDCVGAVAAEIDRVTLKLIGREFVQ